MRRHAAESLVTSRAVLLSLLASAAVFALVLGACTSGGPTATPTRTAAIIVVTPTLAPPTAVPPTSAPPTALPPPTGPTATAMPEEATLTPTFTAAQPTAAPPTPGQPPTVEPYPIELTPTPTTEGYPAPSS